MIQRLETDKINIKWWSVGSNLYLQEEVNINIPWKDSSLIQAKYKIDIYKLNYTKIKNFYSWEDTIMEVKIQAMY